MTIDIGTVYDPNGNVMARHAITFTDDCDTAKDLAILQMLARLSTDSEAKKQAGWLVTHKHPGDSEPVSRWDRLVRYIDNNEVHEKLKGLGLKEHGNESGIAA